MLHSSSVITSARMAAFPILSLPKYMAYKVKGVGFITSYRENEEIRKFCIMLDGLDDVLACVQYDASYPTTS